MKFKHLLGAALTVLAGGLAAQALADTDPMKSPQYCGSCHTRIYEEWSSSAMGKELDNSIVYQFYTGTNPKGEKDGFGYQGMHPGKAGDCADCHVPQLVIDEHKQGREVDLGVAMREKSDHGISCHFCHSVSHVDLEKDASGRYDTRIFNSVTQDTSGAMLGPREEAEATVHPVKLSTLHKDSKLCGTCHLNQEKFLSISTYDDWKEAFDSGKTNETCQTCHMPLHEGKVEVAVGGPKRAGVRSHTFIGAHDPELLAKALDLKLETRIEGRELVVTTTVENVGAGHKVPGSGPIRNVILKIDAADATGQPLDYTGDDTGRLPPLAGMGNPKTKQRGPQDWGGLPGKMYAKVYKSAFLPKFGREMMGVGGFMAEGIAFDTALKPLEPDTVEFRFALPEEGGSAKITARLVYRWAFKPLADMKGWSLDDRPMRQARATLQIPAVKVADR